jgi:hypothetical protein
MSKKEEFAYPNNMRKIIIIVLQILTMLSFLSAHFIQFIMVQYVFIDWIILGSVDTTYIHIALNFCLWMGIGLQILIIILLGSEKK